MVSFGHLLPAESIESCQHGILNVHGSLLPRWRGASPIHHAIKAGDEVTGVTIMKIKPDKFDVGEIVATRELRITETSTTRQLYKQLAEMGADLLMETLSNLEERLRAATPQPRVGVTLAPKPKKCDGFVSWTTMSATEVDRRSRAFDGLIDLFTYWIDGTELRLYQSVPPRIVADFRIDQLVAPLNPVPGFVFYHKKRRLLCVKCGDLKYAAFESVALKNHKRMTALEFYNGFLNKVLIANRNEPVILQSLPDVRHCTSRREIKSQRD